MTHTNWTLAATLAFLVAYVPQAQATDDADPLFSSHDALEITITAPIEQLMDERPLEDELSGTLSYADQGGETVTLDIGIRTRGRYRRQVRTCPFAPIRLNIQTGQAKDTVFHRQDKLKLVTHCRDSERYEQVALKEYLLYRVLNILTDYSFRVRLVRINYVDTDNPDRERIRYGFLIEHRDRLAHRVDRPVLKIPRTSVAALLPEYTNLTSIFQYFIANTDFSPILGARDDFCCHNTNLFGEEGGLLHSIPYDFDMAGLTDAPYATPNERFRIRSVRQRLYRGRCVNNDHVPQSLQAFRDHREEIYALINGFEPLTNSSRRSMISLIDRFYDLIDDPRQVDRQIIRRCV